MSRKNFKVATDTNGQTTLNKIDKTPTGKVKTIKDKEVIRKEREEQYKNFRIGALKRRAKRMGLTDEQIEEKVKELINQINTPNSYFVLIMFNPKDADLLKQALMNEGLAWKIMGANYAYVEADQETLATIREIAPPDAKIHPYVKKKPPILPVQEPVVSGKKPLTKAEKKAMAKKAKLARKAKRAEKNDLKGIMCFRKRVNEMRKSKAQRAEEKAERKKNHIKRKFYTGQFAGKTAAQKKKISAEMKTHAKLVKAARIASKKARSTTVLMTPKNASEGSKTTLAAAA